MSRMVTLCPCDNALVIRAHYSNGCRYKDLLTLGRCGGEGGGHHSGSTLPAFCVRFPLPACLCSSPPLPGSPSPPTHIHPLLKWWGDSFPTCERVHVWECAQVCVIDGEIYELGCAFWYLLPEGFELGGRERENQRTAWKQEEETD